MKKSYAILLILVILLVLSIYLNQRSSMTISPGAVSGGKAPSASDSEKRPTLEPGDVVEMYTTKGKIEFVLLEKDCPKTSKTIASLAAGGNYDDVGFAFVDQLRVHTGPAKGHLNGLAREAVDGLSNAKGTVGLLPSKDDPSSDTTSIYILKDPQPIMDGDYTVFGRLISGMDVVYKISLGDKIKYMKVRHLTASDRSAFVRALRLEAERLVE